MTFALNSPGVKSQNRKKEKNMENHFFSPHFLGGLHHIYGHLMSLSDYNLLPSLVPYIEAGCDKNMLKMSFLAFKANFEHDDVMKIY